MTPEACAEIVRDAIPALAEPIRPGENVATWIERAARRCGVNAGRLKAYWHRRVTRPAAHEYFAIVGAAQAAEARRRAIETLETEIEVRAALLRADHERLASGHPLLARLVPTAPAEAEAFKAASPVDLETVRFYSRAARMEGEERRRAGGR